MTIILWIISLCVPLGFAYESYPGAIVMGIVAYGLCHSLYPVIREQKRPTETQRVEFFSCYFVLLGRMCYFSDHPQNRRRVLLMQLKLFNLPKVEEENAVRLFNSGVNHVLNITDMIRRLHYTLPRDELMAALVFRLAQVERNLNSAQRQLLIDILEESGLCAMRLADTVLEYVPVVIENELMPFYKILELSQDADFQECKLQYHRLMKRYHPDKAGAGADQHKAQEVIRAYKILKAYYQQQQAYQC